MRCLCAYRQHSGRAGLRTEPDSQLTDQVPLPSLSSFVGVLSLHDAHPATCALVLVFGHLLIRGDDDSGVVAIAKRPFWCFWVQKPSMSGPQLTNLKVWKARASGTATAPRSVFDLRALRCRLSQASIRIERDGSFLESAVVLPLRL